MVKLVPLTQLKDLEVPNTSEVEVEEEVEELCSGEEPAVVLLDMGDLAH